MPCYVKIVGKLKLLLFLKPPPHRQTYICREKAQRAPRVAKMIFIIL